MQLKRKKKICAVSGEVAVTNQICQKWFVMFLGTTDILAKKFLVVGLPYNWEMFSNTPGLYPLEVNSRR